ncbi:hypothetical protein OS493_026676 [Desmophyllum pertusum]|uniref:folate gamma-glutamyl hydrolase n=1 Tax=Desmophyllum pertusum TaxID=174260 RepID=A0A9W9ZZQ2_9CNID|nr:hypothetical protein OS493_026676 [Desmophyllum pertusum]
MGNLFATRKCEVVPKNKRPVIGILFQDSSERFIKFGKSYLASSYVKYIESAGARVVPIRIDLSKEELEALFNSINGVLFPGGGASLSDSGYLRTAKIIYDLALQAYDKDDPFPLWGTCLGFELLNIVTSGLGKEEFLASCDAENYSIPLEFTHDAYGSRMFGSAPDGVMKTLKDQAVTFNMHKKCVTIERFWATNATAGFFNVLSTNKDRNGIEFISTVEGKKYPIYGTQWHPEKHQFEWEPTEAIDHSPDAIHAGQYMADFFVNQARQNTHHFATAEEEEKALIYQCNPIDTSEESTFQQCYFF